MSLMDWAYKQNDKKFRTLIVSQIYDSRKNKWRMISFEQLEPTQFERGLIVPEGEFDG